jgi:hypothetical protein
MTPDCKCIVVHVSEDAHAQARELAKERRQTVKWLVESLISDEHRRAHAPPVTYLQRRAELLARPLAWRSATTKQETRQ